MSSFKKKARPKILATYKKKLLISNAVQRLNSIPTVETFEANKFLISKNQLTKYV